MTVDREYVDFCVLAPYSQPLLIMWSHMILLDGQSDSDNITPRGSAVQRIPYMNTAVVRITVYSSAGAQVSQVSITLAATTMENNLGQHTIPAGGRMVITLRGLEAGYEPGAIMPAMYMYFQVPIE
ncbi:MAG: hypothetical protein BWY63_00267 [Chloroflexi bacterium ADurb.Bin360]|nr:MAG: hypothetical protein BWY63_00267 [Chloroflexi bacterium ADurb.Bin360]